MKAPSTQTLLSFLESVGEITVADLLTRATDPPDHVLHEMKSLVRDGYASLEGNQDVVDGIEEHVRDLQREGLAGPEIQSRILSDLTPQAAEARLALTLRGFGKARRR